MKANAALSQLQSGQSPGDDEGIFDRGASKLRDLIRGGSRPDSPSRGEEEGPREEGRMSKLVQEWKAKWR